MTKSKSSLIRYVVISGSGITTPALPPSLELLASISPKVLQTCKKIQLTYKIQEVFKNIKKNIN